MAHRARILIVDDERFNIDILVELLRSDYAIMVAKNGKRALETARSHTPPDLILLDILMPEIDGYEVCRRLKADEKTRHIPVIFVTAMQSINDETTGLNLGAVDYITKPLSPPIVRARVKTHLDVLMAQNEVRSLNQELQHALDDQKRAYEILEQTQIQLAETQAMAVMTRVFEKFVPKQFLTCIAKDGLEHIKLGTVELNTVTLLFSDIRSFTHMAESMTPGDVFSFLNSYLHRMQTPIEHHNGFIDKFIGDAIMALFDGEQAHQTRNAARAARDMQRHLHAYNQERNTWGQHPIHAGIGLHTGPVMMGTIGSENRMDSTVIGDVVNLAARLETLTKSYRCRIIISDDLFRCLDPDDFCCRTLDRVVVKGRTHPVLVHELLDPELEPEKTSPTFRARFQQGIDLFYARQWESSRACFQACLEQHADDYVSTMYLERCTLFMASPPGADWDGTFTTPNP